MFCWVICLKYFTLIQKWIGFLKKNSAQKIWVQFCFHTNKFFINFFQRLLKMKFQPEKFSFSFVFSDLSSIIFKGIYFQAKQRLKNEVISCMTLEKACQAHQFVNAHDSFAIIIIFHYIVVTRFHFFNKLVRQLTSRFLLIPGRKRSFCTPFTLHFMERQACTH